MQPNPQSDRPTAKSRQKSPLNAYLGWFRKLGKFPFGALCSVLCITLFTGHAGPISHLSRMLGAAAAITESMSNLTANVLVRTSASLLR